jgi:hypothetical protein
MKFFIVAGVYAYYQLAGRQAFSQAQGQLCPANATGQGQNQWFQHNWFNSMTAGIHHLRLTRFGQFCVIRETKAP